MIVYVACMRDESYFFKLMEWLMASKLVILWHWPQRFCHHWYQRLPLNILDHLHLSTLSHFISSCFILMLIIQRIAFPKFFTVWASVWWWVMFGFYKRRQISVCYHRIPYTREFLVQIFLLALNTLKTLSNLIKPALVALLTCQQVPVLAVLFYL
jgi:hypothetical protein